MKVTKASMSNGHLGLQHLVFDFYSFSKLVSLQKCLLSGVNETIEFFLPDALDKIS